MIQVELQNQIVPQNIPVSWTWCNFGGARPWLICQCGRRVARLFMGLGGYYCRSCCGKPVYESQRRSKKARSFLKAYRLRQRLGGSRPVVDPLPARPYGMRRKTYTRICERIERLEATTRRQPCRASRAFVVSAARLLISIVAVQLASLPRPSFDMKANYARLAEWPKTWPGGDGPPTWARFCATVRPSMKACALLGSLNNCV